MNNSPAERDLSQHFSFGDNWASFATRVEESHLSAAIVEIQRLLGRTSLRELSILDLGCGSGLHSVAAARLGATVTSVDIDPASVATTQRLAIQFGVEDRITVREGSVFDDLLSGGTFDVVYSWGVLHHTGDMWDAIRKSTELVAPDGELVIAIYRKTRFCKFWKIEKKLYSRSPKFIQGLIRLPYTALADLARLARGTTPWSYRRRYIASRGMRVSTDVHDWLGGYPYESAAPWEIRPFLANIGFEERASFVRKEDSLPWQPFGSGCDEYRFVRTEI